MIKTDDGKVKAGWITCCDYSCVVEDVTITIALSATYILRRDLLLTCG